MTPVSPSTPSSRRDVLILIHEQFFFQPQRSATPLEIPQFFFPPLDQLSCFFLRFRVCFLRHVCGGAPGYYDHGYRNGVGVGWDGKGGGASTSLNHVRRVMCPRAELPAMVLYHLASQLIERFELPLEVTPDLSALRTLFPEALRTNHLRCQTTFCDLRRHRVPTSVDPWEFSGHQPSVFAADRGDPRACGAGDRQPGWLDCRRPHRPAAHSAPEDARYVGCFPVDKPAVNCRSSFTLHPTIVLGLKSCSLLRHINSHSHTCLSTGHPSRVSGPPLSVAADGVRIIASCSPKAAAWAALRDRHPPPLTVDLPPLPTAGPGAAMDTASSSYFSAIPMIPPIIVIFKFLLLLNLLEFRHSTSCNLFFSRIGGHLRISKKTQCNLGGKFGSLISYSISLSTILAETQICDFQDSWPNTKSTAKSTSQIALIFLGDLKWPPLARDFGSQQASKLLVEPTRALMPPRGSRVGCVGRVPQAAHRGPRPTRRHEAAQPDGRPRPEGGGRTPVLPAVRHVEISP